MRVNRRWNQKGQQRTAAQMANAVAAAIWKLSSNALLNLENEDFETTTQSQRLDVLDEIIIYLIHQCDRRIHGQTDLETRSQFISALAQDLARFLEDSHIDMQGDGNYKSEFFEKLNCRVEIYSHFSFAVDSGASFTMRCSFGGFVQEAMGARDNKWIPDYIIGREAPAAEMALQTTLTGLVSFDGLDAS